MDSIGTPVGILFDKFNPKTFHDVGNLEHGTRPELLKMLSFHN